MKPLETMFTLMLTASLTSTVILLLLLLTRKLFHKHLSPRIVHILWLFVLIKLLVPVAPQSHVSLFNLFPHTVPAEWSWQQKSIHPGISSESGHSTIAASDNSREKSLLSESIPNRTEQPAPAIAQPSLADQVYEEERDGQHWITIGALVWLGGLLLLGGYYLCSVLIFRKRVESSRKPGTQEVLTILEACTKKLNLHQTLPVYEASSLRSPCLHGLLQPKIYLPEDIAVIADSNQLTHILMHELTHYKRKDLWFNFLWMLSIGLHWYNPFVWLAVRRMKADQEVACDAGVLEVLGARESSSYGMTLLMLSRLFSQKSVPGINLTHFGEHKNETKRRVVMITRFKRGSYKLSAVAILLIVALGAILLTHASTTGNGTQSDVSPQATNSKEETASSFRIVRPIDSFKWFNNLGRALDFSKFSFKVPDYLPEGYEFQDVEWNKNFSDPNQTDLLDFVSMTYVSHFGSEQEQIIEMLASKGKGSMLEHNLLRGASYSQETIQAPSYRQDAVTIGNVKGVVFTNMQANRHKPGTAKSFVWQDDGVWYAINYYDGNDISEEEIPYYRGKISQEELVKIVQSYTFPQKVQHIRYDGEGNSFPLYDQSDLLKAKNILGFKVKFPLKLPDTTLTLFDSILLRANDQNTGYSFRQSADTLWNTYRAPHDSQIYELNDEVYLYQNKTPLFDAAKLSPVRKLEMNGIEVSAYNDPNHVYYGPIHSDEDKLKLKSQTFYLWQHDSIYYAAVFLGMDQNQEKILEALVTAPSQ